LNRFCVISIPHNHTVIQRYPALFFVTLIPVINFPTLPGGENCDLTQAAGLLLIIDPGFETVLLFETDVHHQVIGQVLKLAFQQVDIGGRRDQQFSPCPE
jgi:hypothetical protein